MKDHAVMQCMEISQPGGPDVLRLVERRIPVPAADEVLIRVAAAGVNRADIIQRKGFYPPPAGASDIPGLEVAGTIAAVGANVLQWRVGDSVCALLSGGGYSSHALAVADECLPVPQALALKHAAALPEAILTVWSNVIQRAALQPGETVLIHGGGSGIGTAAIQLCKLFGCTVFTTVGSAEKAGAVCALGADHVVNYRENDYVEELLNITAGRGVDVILDMVGGDYVQRNIVVAARDARIVNIAYLNGSRVEVDLLPVMLKRLTLTGSTLRAREKPFKAALVREVRERVWPWVASGRYRPVLGGEFPLAEAAAAHKLMESSAHIGKLLLVP